MTDTEKDFAKTLKKMATNIKKYRNRLGLTQEDMADYNFNYRFYQKIESGKYSCNLFTLQKLANAFKVEIQDLLK